MLILKKSEEKGGRGLVPATGWKLFSSSAHLVPSPHPYHHYTKTKCPCVPASLRSVLKLRKSVWDSIIFRTFASSIADTPLKRCRPKAT